MLNDVPQLIGFREVSMETTEGGDPIAVPLQFHVSIMGSNHMQ